MRACLSMPQVLRVPYPSYTCQGAAAAALSSIDPVGKLQGETGDAPVDTVPAQADAEAAAAAAAAATAGTWSKRHQMYAPHHI